MLLLFSHSYKHIIDHWHCCNTGIFRLMYFNAKFGLSSIGNNMSGSSKLSRNPCQPFNIELIYLLPLTF